MASRHIVLASAALLLVLLLLGVAVAVLFPPPPAGAAARKVLVLGFDGMDPNLLGQLIAAGQMPNFAALAQRGDLSPLQTITPPQSPVAWASVITGMDPGGTGIFDFIHRDPRKMTPYLSTSRVEEPKHVLNLGSWVLPLDAGKVEQLRHGEAFWQILDRHGIPATVLKMPSNFPPVETDSFTLSGMGTPDVKGTYGTFHVYTDDPVLLNATVSGGEVHKVTLADGRFAGLLPGPPNTMRKGKPSTTVPFTAYVDPERDVVRIDLGDEKLLLARGEWSKWVAVDFDLVPFVAGVHGIVRFHLTSAHPRLKLYASPVNMDPTSPALPISTPEEFSAEIAATMGKFYTQGMPEDTKALSAGALDDDGFMRQAAIIQDEEERMLDFALERFHEGFLFVYFSSSDQVAHVMWRAMDPQHPMWKPALGREHGDAIAQIYRGLDRALGKALAKAGPDALVLVISDHGFAPFYREVHLNTWLKDQGYLVLTDDALEARTEFFNHVDWGRTRAYAMGLNGLYINRRGREAWGIVDSGAEADALMDELEGKLLALTDHATGSHAIAKLYRASRIYHGAYVGESPDFLVGYARTYRSSDKSALGSLARPVIQDRLDTWSGDHLMETEAVPGIILANRKLAAGSRGLTDIAPTILEAFGIPKSEAMSGRSLLERTDAGGN